MDLPGELYRMNISCFNGVERGCMFFKIFGIANITDGKFAIYLTQYLNQLIHAYILHLYTGKFNCTVPGTLFTNTVKCPSSTTTSTSRSLSNTMPSVPIRSSTTVNTVSESSSTSSDLFQFDIGGLLFYVVISAGSVVVIALALCLMGLCVSLCYKKQHKRKFIVA